MKTMFGEDEMYEPAASELDERAVEALQPLVNEFTQRGHTFRDVQAVLFAVVYDLTLEGMLQKRDEVRLDKSIKEKFCGKD